MPDIGSRFLALRPEPDFVVVDAASGPLTAGELMKLAQSAPIGLGPKDIVGLRFACPANLARALFLLDGLVAGMVLLPASLTHDQVAALAERIGITTVIDAVPEAKSLPSAANRVLTRWVLTTSGTTGSPKVVDYTFAVLARAIRPPRPGRPHGVWGLMLDPTRFAGSQVLLHGLLGGGRLICPDFNAQLGERVGHLARAGCTYLTATPSLWRRMLMTPSLCEMPLAQASLGGEIADQALISMLMRTFPKARIVHIYGSTEAGQGFGVDDGRAGFPASMLDQVPPDLQMKVVDGILWLRPEAAPTGEGVLYDAEGYICTADRVRIEGDRVYFLGRASTSVNVGGIKVQPEEVEAVLRDHPAVAECRVSARPSALLGSLLVAEVVPGPAAPSDLPLALKRFCRERLPRAAQPATITLVAAIATTGAGKLAREPAV
jgi:acyl-CoA synthetase (AMP-forming)/AMP-acid ligase II